jgi:hypothetical protein
MLFSGYLNNNTRTPLVKLKAQEKASLTLCALPLSKLKNCKEKRT